MSYHLSENCFTELREEYSGICLSCHTVKHGDTEPDAERYECENCGKNKVYGIENLLLMGFVTIDESAEKPYVSLRKKATGEVYQKEIIF